MPDNTTTPAENNNTGSDKKEQERQKAHESLINTLKLGLIAGGVGTLGYPFTLSSIQPKLVFICLLIAFAAFISGYFLGTLFGMPKRNNAQDSNYALNNSLVEISEWLTKIIVGLGLINLKQIPGYMKKFGAFVQETTGVTDGSINIFSISIVIFFSLFGLYIGYNYMRLVLSRQYKDEDDNLLTQLAKANDAKQKAEEEKQKAEEEKLKAEAERQKAEEAKIKIMDKVNQENTGDQVPETEAPEATRGAESEEVKGARLFQNENIKSNIEQMKEAALQKFTKGMKENAAANDPQKDQWGGVSVKNNRKLEAKYEEIAQGAYQITLTVSATDQAQFPLNDNEPVLFALHQTFGDPPFRIAYTKDGKATTSFFCYGSFTVGAFVSDTQTELELNLATLPGTSEYFKTH